MCVAGMFNIASKKWARLEHNYFCAEVLEEIQ